VWCLAMKVVPPGDTCRGRVCSGAWRLAACVPRQAIWKHVALDDSWIALDDSVLHALDVRDLQGFGDISKVDLLVFLELWLITYPLSCGLGWGLNTWRSLSCGSEWHLLSCGSGWWMNTRNSWVVAWVGECCRCECARCGVYKGSS